MYTIYNCKYVILARFGIISNFCSKNYAHATTVPNSKEKEVRYMKHTHFKKLLGWVLALAMLLSIVPAQVLAADGETIAGAPETVKVNGLGELQRENNINSGWKFNLGDVSNAQNKAFDDSGWEDVDLPHDFSIFQDFTTSGEAESGFLPGGTGWYRKSIVLPASAAGSRFMLNFDGAYSDTYLYVNGTYVGENHFGYGTFAFDITDYLTCDGGTENIIAVKVVNQLPNSRFYSGSGIYRDVTLVVTGDIHVDRHGTTVTTPNISSGRGNVNVAVDVVNEGSSSKSVTVTNTVYEKDGTSAVATASTTVTVGAGKTVTANANPVVSSPKLWSVDSPNLYIVRTTLTVDGTEVDSYDSDLGFRWSEYKDSGYYLNGKALKLNGVCLHHDQGALGAAAYDDAMFRQLSIMKDMGANAIRVTHNPADEDFIDMCNELGLLVIEEAFDMWSQPRNGNTYDFSQYFSKNIASNNGIYGGDSSMTWAEFSIKEMVRRDVNDPCIIMWSIGNEVQNATTGGYSHFPDLAKDIVSWVREADTTRPCTIGSNLRETDTSTTFGQILSNLDNGGDVVGFNYLKGDSDRDALYNVYGAYLASETVSAINSRGGYKGTGNSSAVDGNYHLTAYDTSSVSWGRTAHQAIWDIISDDYIYGQFVWTGFDYIGEPTPWNGKETGSVSGAGAIPNSSYFGIVETTGFEKDTYWLYRSQWNQDTTTLHLVNAWDADNQKLTSGKTPVWVYSNAPTVKLYRNGEHIGTATRKVNTTAAGHVYYTYTTQSHNTSVCTTSSGSGSSSLYSVFDVTYAAGTLSAKAFDENGKEITLTGNSGKNTISTPGTPAMLDATADKTAIPADGSSLVYIEVDLEDANGNLDTDPTPSKAPTVKFDLTGNGVILGVDNGDQATTDKYQQDTVLFSDTSAQIKTYAGKALVIVRSTDEAGSFTVNVSANGLTGESITVQTTAVEEDVAQTGLTDYTIVRDYSVRVGTAPTFDTKASGTLADGTTISGSVKWDAVSESTYNTVGDHIISGVMTLDGQAAIKVTCRLHVIDNVIAMRNIAVATLPGIEPTLPDTVMGVLPDGTLSGAFSVSWSKKAASAFANVGDVVIVDGTVDVLGETLPVTASVRVAKAENQESQNVGLQGDADFLRQDIAAENQCDNLNSLWDGKTDPYTTAASNDSSHRWTNWANRYNSDTVTLEWEWNTVRIIDKVNMHYFIKDSTLLPASVKFQYSANGTDFYEIGYTKGDSVTPLTYGEIHTYNFDEPIQLVKLRIVLTQQGGITGGKNVGMTEVEIMSYSAGYTAHTSAALSGITVNGEALSGFNGDTTDYEVTVPTLDGLRVGATAGENMGITILPAYKGVAHILTVSEDSRSAKTYAITVSEPPILIGDVDRNGAVDVADIQALQEIIMSADAPTEDQLAYGDIDGNGKLNVVDILRIKNTILK